MPSQSPARHPLWLDHDQIAASSTIRGLWPLGRPLDEVPSGPQTQRRFSR